MISPLATAVFLSSHDLKGTLTKDTKVFFVGKTEINGTFTGYPMERLINSSFFQEMNAFPLVGASSITNLDTCGLYLLLFINIIFSLIHFNSLFPMG